MDKKQLVKELNGEIKACKKDMREYHDHSVKEIMDLLDTDDLTSNEAFDRGFIRGLEVALDYIK